MKTDKAIAFLIEYDKKEASEPAFDEIGVEGYDEKERIIQELKGRGYLWEKEEGVVLEVTKKGKKKIKEVKGEQGREE